MDMNDILKMMLANGAVEQVSKQAGVSQSDAAAVMQDVLPMLLKGMQGQAANKSTQEGFLKALNEHSQQDTSDLTRFFRNVDTDDGAKIVNHLLGSQQEEVAARAKKKSGIDTKTVLKIMAILAPLLMSKMGSTAKTTAKARKKSSGNDMLDVVTGLMDGVDAGDLIKLAGVLMK